MNQCLSCGKDINGSKTKKFCGDACRMAFKRNPNKKPNISQPEQIEPEQKEQPEHNPNTNVTLSNEESEDLKVKPLTRPNLYSKSGKPPFELCPKHNVFHSSCHC